MLNAVNIVSSFAVPFVIFCIISCGLLKNVNVYSSFLDGAKDGLRIGVEIIPPVLGLLVAIGMFRASGALDLVVYAFSPVTDFLGIPREIVPFAVMRPVSGSGSLAMATDVFKNYGTDTLPGRAVAVMMGSTETTFYTLAVYFGATKATDTRHTLKCALAGDVVSLILSVWICRWFFV